MAVLIIYSFTLAVIMAAQAMPETLHNAPIAIVDEDHSHLSNRIVDAFFPPLFQRPALINWAEMDAGMDAGRFTFALDIPGFRCAMCWPAITQGFSSISTPPG